MSSISRRFLDQCSIVDVEFFLVAAIGERMIDVATWSLAFTCVFLDCGTEMLRQVLSVRPQPNLYFKNGREVTKRAMELN